MEIKKKLLKEVEDVVGYKCDICENEIDIDPYFKNLKLTQINYKTLEGGWGEREKEIALHICSVDCLIKGIHRADFGANVILSRKMIEELINRLK